MNFREVIEMTRKIQAQLEALGYRIKHWFDPDLGDVYEAVVGDRVVARVVRIADPEEALRALAGELGVALEEPDEGAEV
jgi:hypothetical protein